MAPFPKGVQELQESRSDRIRGGIQFVCRTRAYAFLLIFVASAFLASTPDAVSMAMMGGPMYLLYEICILIAWLMGRKRKKDADALPQKKVSRMRHFGFGLLSVLVVGGCSRSPEETGPSPEVPDVSASRPGEAIFQTRCFVCHGRQGKGDGPASSGLGATVRDLTTPSWQDATSDETIQSVIRNGAQAVGGSAAMAPNRDLSDAQIQSLVRYIRGLRK